MENKGSDSPAELLTAFPLLLVHDVAQTVAYYRDVLGFPEALSFGNPPGYAVVKRGPAGIHLMPAPAAELVGPNHLINDHAADIYWEVSDVDALHAELTARGVRVLRGPETYPSGTREIAIEDCNGYWICFSQEL
jgi:catechol 2,3-dioxygenase-like lactoylglutathione lyase family enzyme